LALRAGSFCETSFRFCCFYFPVPGRGIGFERAEKPSGGFGDFIEGSNERAFVCFRWFVEAADFPHELKGSISNLFRSDGRFEIEKDFDVPAHLISPQDLGSAVAAASGEFW
jgi:hypothetical protein